MICQTEEIWIRNGKRVNPMKKHKKSGGFIFNSGEGIVAETPEINLKTMIQTVKRLGGTDTPMSRFSARDN